MTGPFRRPALWAAALILGALGLALPALRLETDNGLHVWLSADDPAREAYDRFTERFGPDDFLLVGAVDRAEADLARDLPALAARLRAVPGVEAVVAPTAVGASLRADDAAAAPLLARGGHGVSAAALVRLAADRSPDERAAAADAVLEMAGAAPGGPFHVAGPTAINRALDRESRASFAALLPATGVGLLIALGIGLRSARAAAAVALSAGLAAAASVGLVAVAGRPFHMVLTVLPALVLVLGSAYALHPIARFLDDPPRSGERPAARWRRACSQTLRPALVAAGTTAAGLGSLVFAELPPLRDLGAFGAAGVGVAFVLSYALVPPLMLLLRVQPRPAAAPRGRLGDLLVRLTSRRPAAVLAAAGALTALAAAGVAGVRVESNVLRLLPDGASVSRATAALESRLLGLTPIEVVVEGPSAELLSAATVLAARGFAERCRADPLVTHVLSPFDAFDALDTGPAEPDPRRLQLGREGGAARITLCSRTVASEASGDLAARVGAWAREAGFPGGVRAEVTGAIPILVRLQHELVTSQLESFAGALALVSLLLLAHLRSLRLALLALVPNVIPALVAAGAMGWLGIPLDAATVAVASLALGLAVDDTVHLLHVHRHNGGDLRGTLVALARPVLMTTGGTVAGFAGFAASPFPPARRFGLLVAGSAAVAVAAELFVLPALLSLGPRAPSRSPGSPGPVAQGVAA